MVTPNDPPLVVSFKPCQSGKKLVSMLSIQYAGMKRRREGQGYFIFVALTVLNCFL